MDSKTDDKPSGSGLFGNLDSKKESDKPKKTEEAPKGGLFSQMAQNVETKKNEVKKEEAPKSGLFENLSNKPSQENTSGGLFNNLGGVSAPDAKKDENTAKKPAGGTGLFDNLGGGDANKNDTKP